MFIYYASRVLIWALVACLVILFPFVYSGTPLGAYGSFGLVLLPLVILSPLAIIGVLVSTPPTTRTIRILKKLIWVLLACVVLLVVLATVLVLLLPEFGALGLLMMPLTVYGLPIILIATVGIIVADHFAPKP